LFYYSTPESRAVFTFFLRRGNVNKRLSFVIGCALITIPWLFSCIIQRTFPLSPLYTVVTEVSRLRRNHQCPAAPTPSSGDILRIGSILRSAFLVSISNKGAFMGKTSPIRLTIRKVHFNGPFRPTRAVIHAGSRLWNMAETNIPIVAILKLPVDSFNTIRKRENDSISFFNMILTGALVSSLVFAIVIKRPEVMRRCPQQCLRGIL